jgi:hypothetical protein
MRQFSIACAAAAMAITAVAATSPAKASFDLIRWEGTGFCQIWDRSIPTVPYPSDYTTVTAELPTFGDALVAKDGLLRAGTCSY